MQQLSSRWPFTGIYDRVGSLQTDYPSMLFKKNLETLRAALDDAALLARTPPT